MNELDLKLERYMDFDGGFFIEAGANDGLSYSNTYYFEKARGWSGILVEGIPELYQKCKQIRTGSKVFNCALVAEALPGKHVVMHYANLMSLVEGTRGGSGNDSEWIKNGLQIQRLADTYSIKVPARTLTSILDQCEAKRIDLLSLDVEGYELEVLKGLDLTQYRPRYMCIEVWHRKEIEDYILPYYDVTEELTERDILYRARETSRRRT